MNKTLLIALTVLAMVLLIISPALAASPETLKDGKLWSNAPGLLEPTYGQDQPYGWAAQYITEAVRWDMFTGFEDQTFRPDAPVTRAQFAAVLSRLLGLPIAEPASQPYWYSGYLDALRNSGLVLAEGNWDEPAKRGEVAAWVGQALRLNGVKPSLDVPVFADMSSSQPGVDDITLAVRTGVLSGFPDGTFRPSEFLNRAQASKVAVEFAQRIVNNTPKLDKLQAALSDALQALTDFESRKDTDLKKLEPYFSKSILYAKRPIVIRGSLTDLTPIPWVPLEESLASMKYQNSSNGYDNVAVRPIVISNTLAHLEAGMRVRSFGAGSTIEINWLRTVAGYHVWLRKSGDSWQVTYFYWKGYNKPGQSLTQKTPDWYEYVFSTIFSSGLESPKNINIIKQGDPAWVMVEAWNLTPIAIELSGGIRIAPLYRRFSSQPNIWWGKFNANLPPGVYKAKVLATRPDGTLFIDATDTLEVSP